MWKFASAKAKSLGNIDLVLVSPQVPENIGLVARMLKNTCFSHLSLVNPNLSEKSYEVAKRARDILNQAKKLCEVRKGGVIRRRPAFGGTMIPINRDNSTKWFFFISIRKTTVSLKEVRDV